MLSRSFPYERSLKQLGEQKHPKRHPKLDNLMGELGVPKDLELSQQHDCSVQFMWEGLERFMKTVEVAGRVGVETKEFQH